MEAFRAVRGQDEADRAVTKPAAAVVEEDLGSRQPSRNDRSIQAIFSCVSMSPVRKSLVPAS